MDDGLTFSAVWRKGCLVIRGEAPVSAHFSGPGLVRVLRAEPGEIVFEFRYQKQLHQARQFTGNESPEKFEVNLGCVAERLARIRIRIEGRNDYVIERHRRLT